MSALLDSVLGALLPRGGHVLVLYNAYIDESGCDDYSKVLAVGGYMVDASAARTMEAKWVATLKRHDLPHFHMVDCAPGNKAFKGLSTSVRAQIQNRFMTIIEEHIQYGVSVVIPIKSNNPDYAGMLSDPYTYGLFMCINFMKSVIIDNSPRSKLAIFFEAGHASGGKSKKVLDNVMASEQGSKYDIFIGYTFAKKGELCLLEAADMLVWQTAKYIKDAAFTARPPRKDFHRLSKNKLNIIYPFFAKNRATVIVDRYPYLTNPEKEQMIIEMFGGVESFSAESLKNWLDKDIGDSKDAYITIDGKLHLLKDWVALKKTT